MSLSAISKDGQDWLSLCLDPYHDYSRPIEGMPDESTAHSFVRCHIQQQTFSATAEGDKFRIMFTGFHAPEAMELADFDEVASGNVSSTVNIYPIHVMRSAAAVTTNIKSTTHLGGFYTTPSVDIPSRLIAIGIEVTDVTQRLYQQGTLGVVRLSGVTDHVDNIICLDDDGSDVFVSMTCQRKPVLPASRAIGGLYPSYCEWMAHQGVYATPRFTKAQQPALFKVGTSSDPNNYHFHPVELREATSEGNDVRFVSCHSSQALEYYTTARGGVDSGFDPLTIFIEGTDANAQFRVSVKTYVEYFPECSNGTALASSSPSPCYDPAAFAAYHRAAIRLPSGVPVAMNAKGDWWRMVKSALGKTATFLDQAMPTIASATGTALGRPELGALSAGLYKSMRPLIQAAVQSGQRRKKQRQNRGRQKKQ